MQASSNATPSQDLDFVIEDGWLVDSELIDEESELLDELLEDGSAPGERVDEEPESELLNELLEDGSTAVELVDALNVAGVNSIDIELELLDELLEEHEEEEIGLLAGGGEDVGSSSSISQSLSAGLNFD